MAKESYRFRCPCCKKMLVLDPETGIARELDAKKDLESESMRKLMNQQQREADRLAREFKRAAQDNASHGDKLDALFRKVSREKAPDESPTKNPDPKAGPDHPTR